MEWKRIERTPGLWRRFINWLGDRGPKLDACPSCGRSDMFDGYEYCMHCEVGDAVGPGMIHNVPRPKEGRHPIRLVYSDPADKSSM